MSGWPLLQTHFLFRLFNHIQVLYYLMRTLLVEELKFTFPIVTKIFENFLINFKDRSAFSFTNYLWI